MDQNEVWKTRFFNQACQAAALLNAAVTCYKFDPKRQDGAAKLALKAHKLYMQFVIDKNIIMNYWMLIQVA